MLTRSLRRIVACVLMATVLASTIEVAHADLTSSLDTMINATPPGAYTTQDRGALVGGSVSVRVPVRNVSLFYFDPPRLNAGCGGIDIYMGSFSFINADAFKGMLKAIAQAAAGYFFKLALNAICPPCEAILGSLADLSTILNNNAMNTCKIGRDLASWGANALPNIAQKFEMSAEKMKSWVGDGGQTIASGALSGWVDNFMSIFTNTKAAQDSTKKYTEESGNAVWKALAKSKSTELFDATGGPGQVLGEVEFANTIISLLGTTIVWPQDQMGPPSPEPDRDAVCAANSQACQAKGDVIMPTLTFANILTGSDNGSAKMMRCVDKVTRAYETVIVGNEFGCLDMVSEDFTFIGTQKYVNKWLFCNETTTVLPGPAAATSCWLGGPSEPNSIVGKITSGQTLSAGQVQFLNNFRQPVVRLLMEVQRSRESAEQIAHAFAPYMAMEMAINMGVMMSRIAYKAFSKTTDTMLPPHVAKALDGFSQYMVEAQTANSDIAKQVTQAVELAKAARTMDPVVIAAAFKR